MCVIDSFSQTLEIVDYSELDTIIRLSAASWIPNRHFEKFYWLWMQSDYRLFDVTWNANLLVWPIVRMMQHKI